MSDCKCPAQECGNPGCTCDPSGDYDRAFRKESGENLVAQFHAKVTNLILNGEHYEEVDCGDE